MSTLLESSRSVESGSGLEAAIPSSISSLMESLCSENFGNSIVAAEKLAKEQDSAKIEIDPFLANNIKCAPERIRNILEKFSEIFNENAKRRGVMQKADAKKLWKRVESEFYIAMTLCDQLTETFQLLAGQIQDVEEDDDCLVDKLWDSFEALNSVKAHLSDICGLVLPQITLKDRLKMSHVIVVKTHDKFLRQLDLARTSNILTVFLFHLNCFMSYEKALEEYIELSGQYHYEHGEDGIKFIVAKMQESARMFKVTFYPTVVVMKGNKEVGRVGIFDTGFLTGVFTGLKLLLDCCLEDDEEDSD